MVRSFVIGLGGREGEGEGERERESWVNTYSTKDDGK